MTGPKPFIDLMELRKSDAQYQSFPEAAGDSRTLDKLKALRLPDLQGKAFLDVGCNEGFFCGFALFQGASRVVGLDHSEKFILRAKARFPACEFHHRGWDRLPSGPFDVILLASALHYADDQPALIHELVSLLSPDGTLVLELGIVSSRRAEWRRVKRGIDEREFPSMPMLEKMLAGYAWKWMGPSVSQDGDPVARHVVHVSRRRPVAYLLLQPPGYGKSSIASALFPGAGIPVVSGDTEIARAAKDDGSVPAALHAAVSENFSPFHIDQIIQRIFERGLADELVALWIARAGKGDFAIDAFVPAEHQRTVERILERNGYLPVRLEWGRLGAAPLPEEVMARAAEDFYLSLLDERVGKGPTEKCEWSPAGFVDELSLTDGRLTVRGWAVDSQGALPEGIHASLGRRALGATHFERQLRPDVQRHLGLPHGLVGYQIVFEIPVSGGGSDLKSIRVLAPGCPVFQFSEPLNAMLKGMRN